MEISSMLGPIMAREEDDLSSFGLSRLRRSLRSLKVMSHETIRNDDL